MPHLIVAQLHFARSEFVRCLAGVTVEDACRRIMPMNCISWIIGHLAVQEQFFWVLLAQKRMLFPELNDVVGYGKPASTPPLDEMWETWHTVTTAADEYLNTLTQDHLLADLSYEGKPWRENIGTLLLRNIYHYWFHTGEAHAIRQQLGHTELPQFVGNMSAAQYQALD